jgi:hypothetical protein
VFFDADRVVEILCVGGIGRPCCEIAKVAPLVEFSLDLGVDILGAFSRLNEYIPGEFVANLDSSKRSARFSASRSATASVIWTGPCDSAVPASACASDMAELTGGR